MLKFLENLAGSILSPHLKEEMFPCGNKKK